MKNTVGSLYTEKDMSVPFSEQNLICKYKMQLDNCQVCGGSKGGMLGNENVIEGIVVCDYCHVDYLDGKIDLSSYDKIRDLQN